MNAIVRSRIDITCAGSGSFPVARTWIAASCALLVSLIGVMTFAAATESDSVGVMTFDLPSQSLASAIESYSIVSRWQVIYDADLAKGRRSTAVKGSLTPAAALRMLLRGTGLVPEYMAADGVLLVADPLASGHMASVEPDGRVRGYYGRLQAGLKQVFCADERIRSGAYRIAIGFWIGATGEVTRAAPLGSTGLTEVDAAFTRAVQKLSVGQPPPQGFEQPVTILVTPDLVAQCDVAGRQSTGGGR